MTVEQLVWMCENVNAYTVLVIFDMDKFEDITTLEDMKILDDLTFAQRKRTVKGFEIKEKPYYLEIWV